MIISGKELSAQLKAEMAAQVATFPEKYGRVPHLVVILVGEDPGSVSYVTGKAKASEVVGIKNTTIRKPETITEAELLDLIRELNEDDSVDGILVQLPLPKHISEDKVIATIAKEVDTDGCYYANHVYNPYFYEGTKTYIYEVFEQLKRMPKHIIIPVGNGTLFLGAIYALEHLLASGVIEEMPKIIALQSQNCDPLLQAAERGEDKPAKVTPTPTIAEGIAIGLPMRGEEILRLTHKYNIKYVHAPEDKILEARAALAKKGIYCEHTTAANYAAYLHYCELYGTAEDCLITMCGAGLKSDH